MKANVAVTTLATWIAIAGCHGEPAGPVEAEPVYRSGGVTVSDGVLSASVVLENPGTVAIRFSTSGAGARCLGPFTTRVFSTGGPPGPALWSEDGLPPEVGGCKLPPMLQTMEPGEVWETTDEFPVGLILGDSIPPGAYEVRALVKQVEPVQREITVTLGQTLIAP